MTELVAHSNLPMAARSTSISLRDLEISGRALSTSKPWRSMAFRYLLSAPAEQFQINRQLAIDHLYQRQPAGKPIPRSFDFKFHHGHKLRCCAALRNVFTGYAKAAQVFQRKINAAFAIIDENILPEICQLQCCACVVRELLPFGVTIAA